MDFLGEAESVSVFCLRDTIHLEIVETAEDAFAGYTQAACENAEFQVCPVGLLSGRKEAPHKLDHLVVVAIVRSLCDRSVVFVYQIPGSPRSSVQINVEEVGEPPPRRGGTPSPGGRRRPTDGSLSWTQPVIVHASSQPTSRNSTHKELFI